MPLTPMLPSTVTALRVRSPVILFVLVTTAFAASTRGADLNAGRDIAAGCASCHATKSSSGDAIPVIAGRDKGEIVKAMKDFRDGRRPSTVMRQLAKGYTDAQIEAAAAYLAAQKP